MDNQKQKIIKITNRLDVLAWLLLGLCFSFLALNIWLDETAKFWVLILKFIIGIYFIIYSLQINTKIEALKPFVSAHLYKKATNSRIIFSLSNLVLIAYANIATYIFNNPNILQMLMGIEFIAILTLLVTAILDISKRNNNEEIGDELTQKIRDEAARNAFYFSIFGIGAFQITMAVWVDFKNAIATQFGAQAIDVSIIVSVFIIIASWAIGHLYARGKYR